MRLISQDGKLDVPYERCAVYLRITDEIEIIGYDTENVGFSPWLLGKYSTEEKAREVMELLRTAYAGRFITTSESVSDDFDETMKELMKHGFGTVIVKDNFEGKVEFQNLNGYFIFPKDDEVEG